MSSMAKITTSLVMTEKYSLNFNKTKELWNAEASSTAKKVGFVVAAAFVAIYEAVRFVALGAANLGISAVNSARTFFAARNVQPISSDSKMPEITEEETLVDAALNLATINAAEAEVEAEAKAQAKAQAKLEANSIGAILERFAAKNAAEEAAKPVKTTLWEKIQICLFRG